MRDRTSSQLLQATALTRLPKNHRSRKRQNAGTKLGDRTHPRQVMVAKRKKRRKPRRPPASKGIDHSSDVYLVAFMTLLGAAVRSNMKRTPKAPSDCFLKQLFRMVQHEGDKKGQPCCGARATLSFGVSHPSTVLHGLGKIRNCKPRILPTANLCARLIARARKHNLQVVYHCKWVQRHD